MVSAANKLTGVSLIAGGSYAEREAWIATALANRASEPSLNKSGVLLEGLPSGQLILENSPLLSVERIAPGCFCCIGQIAMRVTFHRLLRLQLAHLYIAINDAQHLSSLKDTLSQPQYAQLLTFENEIII
ncbi:GTPase [Undibacterium flavidum]|uniref:GTPase n=1 Tax=Undibacterium flavidum TaxID=2762297 RepID=A0ABR6YA91_9BURK|nr:GTPase [Undibacterium flavidum]MBC3873511.1 GTPase [Undibacterium flavidum]